MFLALWLGSLDVNAANVQYDTINHLSHIHVMDM